MLGGLLLVFIALVAMAYFMASSARNAAKGTPGNQLPGAAAPPLPGK
jgi:hypothetical protein